MATFRLLTASNPKALKGEAFGYMTFLLHLAPARLSGFNVCPGASLGCTAACLNTAGRGGMFKKGEDTNMIQQARIRRTLAFFNDRDTFIHDLVCDVRQAIIEAERFNLIPCFRLNATSDIRWENEPVRVQGVEYPNIMTAFPDVQWYDYTKLTNRRNLPSNYHLTFSRAEHNEAKAIDFLTAGGNVAVVFAGALPTHWNGFEVVSGDFNDLRFLDGTQKVVGLTAKGRAKKDTSGFVVHAETFTLAQAA